MAEKKEMQNNSANTIFGDFMKEFINTNVNTDTPFEDFTKKFFNTVVNADTQDGDIVKAKFIDEEFKITLNPDTDEVDKDINEILDGLKNYIYTIKVIGRDTKYDNLIEYLTECFELIRKTLPTVYKSVIEECIKVGRDKASDNKNNETKKKESIDSF